MARALSDSVKPPTFAADLQIQPQQLLYPLLFLDLSLSSQASFEREEEDDLTS